MSRTILIFACLLFPLIIPAQSSENKKTILLKYGAQHVGKRTDAAMNKWRANRFGQFIHWGVYSIPGGVWKGKTYPGAAEWLKEWAKVPTPEWDALSNQFDPVNFDARAWAKMAKAMGVKYMIITTKHHEGFCLWPSKYSDFTIANTPYKKDILKQLVDAYNAEGIDVGFYYSVLDWHHPDWRNDIKNDQDAAAFERYLEFAKNQLRELAENYPTVKAFWFDGTWDESVKKNGKWTYDVEKMLKEIRPGVIVNSRLRADDLGARHKDSNGQLMGDYESGYERRLPLPWDSSVTKWDWEACMTIPENQWGYHKDWSLSHVKTSYEIIDLLAHTASLGGNFLLNFGPQPDGVIRPEEQKIAREIGEWMKVNGEAIYDTDYAGFEYQPWGYFTKKQGTNKVYMIVFNVPLSRELRIKLPKDLFEMSIADYKFLDRSLGTLTLSEIAEHEYFLRLPDKKFNGPFVIELELKRGNNPRGKYQKAKT